MQMLYYGVPERPHDDYPLITTANEGIPRAGLRRGKRSPEALLDELASKLSSTPLEFRRK